MIDAYEICDSIYFDHIRYKLIEKFATSWNFRFMDNLYEFGKDFR